MIIQTQENIKATSSLQLPLDYDKDTSFSLTVEGEDLDREVTIFTERTNNFRFESKALSIFIQTDKAIYQPGELSNYNTFYFDIECKCYSNGKSILCSQNHMSSLVKGNFFRFSALRLEFETPAANQKPSRFFVEHVD